MAVQVAAQWPDKQTMDMAARIVSTSSISKATEPAFLSTRPTRVCRGQALWASACKTAHSSQGTHRSEDEHLQQPTAEERRADEEQQSLDERGPTHAPARPLQGGPCFALMIRASAASGPCRRLWHRRRR